MKKVDFLYDFYINIDNDLEIKLCLIIQYEVRAKKLFIDSGDEEFRHRYFDKIKDHNSHVTNDGNPDSGFDLFLPDDTLFKHGSSSFVDFNEVLRPRLSMVSNHQLDLHVSSFKYFETNVRLANNVGIIDSGYRGSIGGYFDVVHTIIMTLPKFHRLTQICSPTLEPFIVTVQYASDSFGLTTRGKVDLDLLGALNLYFHTIYCA